MFFFLSGIMLKLAFYLLVQVNPSPVYSGRQVQVKPSSWLLQLAWALHPPLFIAHLSIAAASHITDQLISKDHA